MMAGERDREEQMDARAIHPGWAHLDVGDVDFEDIRLSMSPSGQYLLMQTIEKLLVYREGQSKPVLSRIRSPTTKCVWIEKSTLVLHESQDTSLKFVEIGEDGHREQEVSLDFGDRTSEISDVWLIAPRDESQAVLTVCEGVAWRVEMTNLNGKPRVRRRWTLLHSPPHINCAWSLACGRLFCLDRENGCLYSWRLGDSSVAERSSLCADLATFSDLVTDDANLLFLKMGGHTTHMVDLARSDLSFGPHLPIVKPIASRDQVSDLRPIDDSSLMFSETNASLVLVSDSLERLIQRYVLPRSSRQRQEWCEANRWEAILLDVIDLEGSLRIADMDRVRRSLDNLTYGLDSLSNALRDRVSNALSLNFRTLIRDDRVDRSAEDLLIKLIQSRPEHAEIAAASLSRLRIQRILFDQMNVPDITTHEVRLPSNEGSLQTLTYSLASGWTTSCSKQSSSPRNTTIDDKTRGSLVRKLLGPRWNTWTHMSDQQVALDGLDKGLLASANAFILARQVDRDGQGQNNFTDSNEFIMKCVRQRAVQYLCDYVKVDATLYKAGLSQLDFYRSVLLSTYNRTLRRNVMHHLLNCEHKAEVLTTEMVEGERFLVALEAAYPCKSHTVALRRAWTRRMLVAPENNPSSGLEPWPSAPIFYRFMDGPRNCTLTCKQRRLLGDLKISLGSEAKDGDDERLVEIICLSCRASMEEYAQRPVGTNSTASLESTEDNFGAFLRFSLRGVIDADDETRWRVNMEAGLCAFEDAPFSVLVEYLIDHNDWRRISSLFHRFDASTDLSSWSDFLRAIFDEEILVTPLTIEERQASEETWVQVRRAAIRTLFDERGINVESPMSHFLPWMSQNDLVDAVHLFVPSEVHEDEPLQSHRALYEAKQFSQSADPVSLWEAAKALGENVSDFLSNCNGQSPDHNHPLNLSKRLLTVLILAPETFPLFQGDWVQALKPHLRTFPEAFLAMTTMESLTGSFQAKRSSFIANFDNQISVIIERLIGKSLRIMTLPVSSESDDIKLVLSPEFFLKLRRPAAAFLARNADDTFDQLVEVARRVAMDRPHDGLVLGACCSFVDMLMPPAGVNGELVSAAIRVDALVLSTVLAALDVSHDDEDEFKVLFASLSDIRSSSIEMRKASVTDDLAVRALGYLLRCMETSSDLVPLALQFCSLHNLSPSLLLLDRVSKAKDVISLILEADSHGLDRGALVSFLTFDSHLEQSSRLLAMKALGLSWSQLESLSLKKGDQRVECLLTPYANKVELLLKLARDAQDLDIAAMASLFEGFDPLEIWRTLLEIRLSSVDERRGNEAQISRLLRIILKALAAASFDQEMADLLIRCNLAFGHHLPVVSQIVEFVLGTGTNLDMLILSEEPPLVDFAKDAIDQHLLRLTDSQARIAVLVKAMDSVLSPRYIPIYLRMSFLLERGKGLDMDRLCSAETVRGWLSGTISEVDVNLVQNVLLAESRFGLARDYATLCGLDEYSTLFAECRHLLKQWSETMKASYTANINPILDRVCSYLEMCPLHRIVREVFVSLLMDPKVEFSGRDRCRIGGRIASLLKTPTGSEFRSLQKLVVLRTLSVGAEFLVDVTGIVLDALDAESDCMDPVSFEPAITSGTNIEDVNRLVLRLIELTRMDDAICVATVFKGSSLRLVRSCSAFSSEMEWREALREDPPLMALSDSLGAGLKEENFEEDSCSALTFWRRLMSLHRQIPCISKRLEEDVVLRYLQEDDRGSELCSLADILLTRMESSEAACRVAEALMLRERNLRTIDLVIAFFARPGNQNMASTLFNEYRVDSCLVACLKCLADRFARSFELVRRSREFLNRFYGDATVDDFLNAIELIWGLQNQLEQDLEKTFIKRVLGENAIEKIKRIDQLSEFQDKIREMVRRYCFIEPLEGVTLMDQIQVVRAFGFWREGALTLERRALELALIGGVSDVVIRQCFYESERLFMKVGDEAGCARVNSRFRQLFPADSTPDEKHEYDTSDQVSV